MLKTGIGLLTQIKIGNGGGGVIMNGGKINHVKNVMIYGINTKMKFKFLKIKEFHY